MLNHSPKHEIVPYALSVLYSKQNLKAFGLEVGQEVLIFYCIFYSQLENKRIANQISDFPAIGHN